VLKRPVGPTIEYDRYLPRGRGHGWKGVESIVRGYDHFIISDIDDLLVPEYERYHRTRVR